MSKYEVWNKHPQGMTHKEMFRGDEILIKANSYILMDYEDAVQFKGQMPATGIRKNAMGEQDPASYKCIQIVPHDPTTVVETPKFVSMIDGKEFATQKELDAHLVQFEEQAFKDPALDRDLEIAAKIKGKPQSKEKTL